jgi:hypothetical protein
MIPVVLNLHSRSSPRPPCSPCFKI